jgi:hypothetical protein
VERTAPPGFNASLHCRNGEHWHAFTAVYEAAPSPAPLASYDSAAQKALNIGVMANASHKDATDVAYCALIQRVGDRAGGENPARLAFLLQAEAHFRMANASRLANGSLAANVSSWGATATAAAIALGPCVHVKLLFNVSGVLARWSGRNDTNSTINCSTADGASGNAGGNASGNMTPPIVYPTFANVTRVATEQSLFDAADHVAGLMLQSQNVTLPSEAREDNLHRGKTFHVFESCGLVASPPIVPDAPPPPPEVDTSTVQPCVCGRRAHRHSFGPVYGGGGTQGVDKWPRPPPPYTGPTRVDVAEWYARPRVQPADANPRATSPVVSSGLAYNLTHFCKYAGQPAAAAAFNKSHPFVNLTSVCINHTSAVEEARVQNQRDHSGYVGASFVQLRFKLKSDLPAGSRLRLELPVGYPYDLGTNPAAFIVAPAGTVAVKGGRAQWAGGRDSQPAEPVGHTKREPGATGYEHAYGPPDAAPYPPSPHIDDPPYPDRRRAATVVATATAEEPYLLGRGGSGRARGTLPADRFWQLGQQRPAANEGGDRVEANTTRALLITLTETPVDPASLGVDTNDLGIDMWADLAYEQATARKAAQDAADLLSGRAVPTFPLRAGTEIEVLFARDSSVHDFPATFDAYAAWNQTFISEVGSEFEAPSDTNISRRLIHGNLSALAVSLPADVDRRVHASCSTTVADTRIYPDVAWKRILPNRLSGLVEGDSVVVVCPADCYAMSDSATVADNHRQLDRKAVWGGGEGFGNDVHASAFFSDDSLVCLAALIGLERNGGVFRLGVRAGASAYGSKLVRLQANGLDAAGNPSAWGAVSNDGVPPMRDTKFTSTSCPQWPCSALTGPAALQEIAAKKAHANGKHYSFDLRPTHTTDGVVPARMTGLRLQLPENRGPFRVADGSAPYEAASFSVNFFDFAPEACAVAADAYAPPPAAHELKVGVDEAARSPRPDLHTLPPVCGWVQRSRVCTGVPVRGDPALTGVPSLESATLSLNASAGAVLGVNSSWAELSTAERENATALTVLALLALLPERGGTVLLPSSEAAAAAAGGGAAAAAEAGGALSTVHCETVWEMQDRSAPHLSTSNASGFDPAEHNSTVAATQSPAGAAAGTVTLHAEWSEPVFRCWQRWADSAEKNATFRDCLCFNSTAFARPPPPVPAPDSLWTGAEGPGDWYAPASLAGISVVNPDARLRFGRGAMTVEGHYISGLGVVEFSGGRHSIQVWRCRVALLPCCLAALPPFCPPPPLVHSRALPVPIATLLACCHLAHPPLGVAYPHCRNMYTAHSASTPTLATDLVQVAELDAEVVVTGGSVLVEQDTVTVTDHNTRADLRANASNRYRFSLHDGTVNFSAIAPQFRVNGNMLLEGGVLQYPVENAYSREHLQRRGLVHVANRFTWRGGACDGNADLRSGGGMFVGGVTKFLRNLWHVVNYGDAYWTTGDIENHPGSTFTNKGTLEYDETQPAPAVQTAPTQEVHRTKGSKNFIHSWDDF